MLSARSAKTAVFADRADNIQRIIHYYLVLTHRQFELTRPFTHGVFRAFPFRNVLDHDEEMARIGVFVPDDATSSRSPDHLPIFSQITFFDAIVQPFQHSDRKSVV